LAFSALSFAFQHFIRYALLAHFRTLNIPITQEKSCLICNEPDVPHCWVDRGNNRSWNQCFRKYSVFQNMC